MIRFTRMAAALATVTALTSAPLQALDLSQMSDTEKDAFGESVRDYLLENPEVILEAIGILEQRQAAAEVNRDAALVQANLEQLHNDGYSFVGGNPDGDITLVEFMDYRCGYCRRAGPEVAKLLKADGNIRWVVKEFPILGEASVTASRFAVAAKLVAGDEAYEDVHHALLELSGEPSEVVLRRLADGLELDADAILAKMNDAEVTSQLRDTRELAQQLQISGTPSFVLEGELLRGFLPADQMAEMIKELRAERG